MICLTSARFNMLAEILTPGEGPEEALPNEGTYTNRQNEDTGEIYRVWVPSTEGTITTTSEKTFKCRASGFIDGGIRVAGTTERFSSRGTTEAVDYVSLKFPANVMLTRRDRVTNIRNNKGIILWAEEEIMGPDGITPIPTVFNVNGVTPIMDPFGKHIENSALLERAEIQQGG